MKDEADPLNKSYCDRQFVVVLDDNVVDAARQAEQSGLERSNVDWRRIGEAAMQALLGPLPSTLISEAMKAWARARASGVQVLQLKKSEARRLVFPPGHPRTGLLYIGHPASELVYFTAASFHRVTFEHKFCEALELLMSLGAQRVHVEHLRGWGREFSARLNVPLRPHAATGGADASVRREGENQLLFEAKFEPQARASLPEELVWFPHEPTWQSIAKGRLKFGLKEFSLSVSYEDDFGVNAGLRMKVEQAGLDLGGGFEDHESTTWRITGDF